MTKISPYLRRSIAVLTNEVESLQLAETLKQLHHLLLVQIGRQTTNENFVDRVRYVGGYDARDVNARSTATAGHIDAAIVLGSADFERSIDEYYAIEGHGGGGVLGAAELERRSARIIIRTQILLTSTKA